MFLLVFWWVSLQERELCLTHPTFGLSLYIAVEECKYLTKTNLGG
jgi:hypothetical protein